MTVFGKLLAFFNLIIGLGFVTYGASVYFQRPSWFEPAPDVVDKGQSPQTFAQLKQETDTFGRASAAASETWGKELRRLEAIEKRREDRRLEWDRRAGWTRKGNPSPPDAKDAGAAFFKPVYETDALGKPTPFLDHTKLGPAVKIAGVALRGSDTLKASYDADVLAVEEAEKQIVAGVKEYDRLGGEILGEEARLLKMSDIRASVQAELFYLSSFEVNVYETRETVFRRKRQLSQRLTELGGK
jgi:hypothetical protein